MGHVMMRGRTILLFGNVFHVLRNLGRNGGDHSNEMGADYVNRTH